MKAAIKGIGKPNKQCARNARPLNKVASGKWTNCTDKKTKTACLCGFPRIPYHTLSNALRAHQPRHKLRSAKWNFQEGRNSGTINGSKALYLGLG